MTDMYQGLENVVVKLDSKTSILLINTHFDSKSGSPGAGDPGAMVVEVLEVLGVLANGNATLLLPIIFFFNGAEENPLQGSQAFILKYKWAKNCKALINSDSAGSGNREILWLRKYYKLAAVHPYATTVAEELFQLNFIQSNTDFRLILITAMFTILNITKKKLLQAQRCKILVKTSYHWLWPSPTLRILRILPKTLLVLLLVSSIGLVLGTSLTVGLGIYMDILGVPMSWVTFKSLILGLNFAPFIFRLALPSVILSHQQGRVASGCRLCGMRQQECPSL